MDEIDKCKRFKDGLQTEIRALVAAIMNKSDFSKLVEVAIRVERCMADEKKNKIVKEKPCGQSTSGMRGSERRNENRRFVPGVHQEEF